MTTEVLQPVWKPADIDGAAVWADCGGQWLTAPGAGVPDRLVRSVVGLCAHLDERGAGLSELFGAAGAGVIGERAAYLGLPASGLESCGGASRLIRAADGWLALSMPRDSDLELVPALLGHAVEDPWAAVEAAAAERPVDELAGRARLLGLPCSRVGETSDGRIELQRVGDADPRRLEGLVVVNLGALWAGPLAADILARLGARVLTVESVHRPDGARATPDFFAALHGRSESVALDLRSPGGQARLRALIHRADVVIEGSRSRALEQMGIHASDLLRTGPQLWASVTSHGRAHNRVGFGDDAAAGGGLVGWIANEPRFLADAVADPITGLTLAACVVQLAESGGRWLADLALSRVAASMADATFGVTRRAATPPRRRRDPGRPMPLGRDTTRVLTEFGIATEPDPRHE